jgi:fatty acid desaturase
MLEKTKEVVIKVFKDPVAAGLAVAYYIICLGVGVWAALYAVAFVQYLLVNVWTNLLGF